LNQKSQEDHKTDISPKKVQDQLEEVTLIMERFIHFLNNIFQEKILLTNILVGT
jgi:hypothetical protein